MSALTALGSGRRQPGRPDPAQLPGQQHREEQRDRQPDAPGQRARHPALAAGAVLGAAQHRDAGGGERADDREQHQGDEPLHRASVAQPSRRAPTRRRAWLLLAATIGAAALFARLGVWQLDRAAQKQALAAAIESRRALPALDSAELATTPEAAAAQHWRAVVVDGRWLPARTVYLDNRPLDGRPGFVVVTPLRLADGSAVAVQRGWLPRDVADRARVQAPPLPAGPVRVEARVAPPPSRLFAFAADPAGAAIRQNLDLGAWSAETGLALRPLSLLQQDGAGTPADGLRRELPGFAAGVARHQGYAFQWFSLSALVVALHVGFRLVRRRR